MAIQTWQVHRYTAGRWEEDSDTLAVETDLKVYLDGEFLRSLLFLPQNPELLVLGYLFNTGLISGAHEVKTMTVDLERHQVWVTRSNLEQEPPHSSVLSSTEPSLSPGTILKLADILSQNRLFQQTGAVHCGLLACHDSVIFSTEDTGRLNVLDKLAGFALTEHPATRELVLVFSGRLTGEVMRRVARMRIPIVVSPAAPTSKGLKIAVANNITVVGFARGKRFNLYTYPERVIGKG
ncbi:MAG: formate dehydrogenase accessory sulfurtransferase FdhD [Bacillota bacterium]